jgi:hypothetical protein
MTERADFHMEGVLGFGDEKGFNLKTADDPPMTAGLDGMFTIEQLEQIIAYMRDAQRRNR